jgi:hypothetical protein
MNLTNVIAQIDAEISRLNQAKQALLGISTQKGPGRPRGASTGAKKATSVKPKRKMSAAGRARIAAAQKVRWAKVKKAAK